jgi:hypothetical protein
MLDPFERQPLLAPMIDDDFIAYCARKFPNRLPDQYVDDFQLGKLLGVQEVIRHFVGLKLQQDRGTTH